MFTRRRFSNYTQVKAEYKLFPHIVLSLITLINFKLCLCDNKLTLNLFNYTFAQVANNYY